MKITIIGVLAMLAASTAAAEEFRVRQQTGDVLDSVYWAMLVTGIPLQPYDQVGNSVSVRIDTDRAGRWIADAIRRRPEVSSVWPQAVNNQQPRLIVRLHDASEAASLLRSQTAVQETPILNRYHDIIVEATNMPVELQRIDGSRFSVRIDIDEAENALNAVLLNRVDYIGKVDRPPY